MRQRARLPAASSGGSAPALRTRRGGQNAVYYNMIGVPEAARRVGRNPETVRRWIREGKLPARKIGTQHFIEEEDLAEFEPSEYLPVPPELERTMSGKPMPDVLAILRRQRASH